MTQHFPISPVAGPLVQQANPQQGRGLHQGGQLQLGVGGGVAGRYMQEQHLADDWVQGTPLGGSHAQQHPHCCGVMLLAEVAVQIGCRQAAEVPCNTGGVKLRLVQDAATCRSLPISGDLHLCGRSEQQALSGLVCAPPHRATRQSSRGQASSTLCLRLSWACQAQLNHRCISV